MCRWEKLGRRWIGSDIPKIAVSVARGRILSVYDSNAGIERTNDKPKYSFEVQSQSAYEKEVEQKDK